jgi:hypothetical protein
MTSPLSFRSTPNSSDNGFPSSMDCLLHRDFASGLAIEAEVPRCFGSSVQFSSSQGGTKFFSVVSFLSASFPLSEEFVGLSHQSCIVGDHKGFIIYQLSDRRLCFLVASKKVGHFIYGLRDRIWARLYFPFYFVSWVASIYQWIRSWLFSFLEF